MVPHKAEEEEGELAGSIVAKTTNTELVSRGKAFADRYQTYKVHMVGNMVGTGLEKQRQGPATMSFVISRPLGPSSLFAHT